MIYREMGKTGIRLSSLGFGGMRFFKRDAETAIATVRRCLDVGINFFETGVSYGDGRSEVQIAKALSGQVAREEIVLANKAHASTLPTADRVRTDLESALQRQQTDYFDLFSLWGVNKPEVLEHAMRPAGPLGALIEARDEGLIRAVGLTTHAKGDLLLDFARAYPWDCITLKEHMLYSRQQEVIAALGKMGIGVVVMSPLAGGVICSPGPDIAAELDAEGISAAVLGLRYLTSNPHVTSVISGMASPAEVQENSKAGQTADPLSPSEKRLVQLIRDKTTALGEQFCTSCGYCVPCRQEVNIPGIFRLWNLMRGYGNQDYSRLEYTKLRERLHWADFPGASAEACVECGECEDRCPEELPIVDDLKQAHADLTPE